MNQKNMELYKKKLELLTKILKIKATKSNHAIKRNLHRINASYHRLNPKERKKYNIIAIAVIMLMVTSIFITSLWSNKALSAYSVEVEDKILGIVRSEEDFWKAMDVVRREVMESYQQELVISEEIKFNSVKADDSNIASEESIIRNIKSLLSFNVKSVAIVVEGKEIVLVRDLATAEAVLEELKEPYIKNESADFEAISFSQKVELIELVTEAGTIRDKEEAVNFILKGSDEEKIHEVASGESTWTIAKKYNLSIEDIIKANPNFNPDKLQIGQKISLIVPKPLISVRTKEYVELVEAIPFETTYEKSNALYDGDKKVVKQGVEGQKELKAYIIKENGVEVEREVLDVKILSQPKEKVVATGTKPRPKTMATGIFASPTRGVLTSGFGMRWGSRHEGIDVAASTGTSILAADGGKVTFAGRNGAYGNLVIVDHENGLQTYYAHANTILVKKGERVHKGQKIATVGSTGRSTGPHLHFEVRKNGKPQNPLNYVRY